MTWTRHGFIGLQVHGIREGRGALPGSLAEHPDPGVEARRFGDRPPLTTKTIHRNQPSELDLMQSASRDPFLQAAIDEARKGLAEGGIPIGSVLVIDGQIVGRGHNRRIQRASAILHAEMDALENAGRLAAAEYRRSILYSTLSPCDMCSGTALLYRIPRIVVGENRTFRGPEDYLRARGVLLEIRDNPECVSLMEEFIRSNPKLWNEDIGV